MSEKIKFDLNSLSIEELKIIIKQGDPGTENDIDAQWHLLHHQSESLRAAKRLGRENPQTLTDFLAEEGEELVLDLCSEVHQVVTRLVAQAAST